MAGNRPVSASSNVRTDLYKPNNSPEFLNTMAEAEFDSRLGKLKAKIKKKKQATNTRKPATILEPYR